MPALADPKLKVRLADLGGTVIAGSPADFGKLIAERNREMGQGDPRGQHQAGMTRPIVARLHKSRSANVRFGSKADISQCRHVRFTPESDAECVHSNVRYVPIADISAALFDHFVGSAEQ